jgi:polar amino acid transport system substrate-binding protein
VSKFLVIGVGGLLPLVLSAADVTEIELNTTTKPPLSTPNQTGFIDRVGEEAFSRLGIKLTTVRLPAERALLDANMGILDGEISRVAGLEQSYTNLVRIPEKLMDIEFTVFSRHVEHLAPGWEALQPYSTAIINGWKILENNIPVAAEVTKVKNPRQLFNLLNLERVDLIIYERWGGMALIDKLQIGSIRRLEPPLLTKGMFMYLHKKYKHLVPGLTQALKDIKADGTYDRIYQQTLKPFEKN